MIFGLPLRSSKSSVIPLHHNFSKNIINFFVLTWRLRRIYTSGFLYIKYYITDTVYKKIKSKILFYNNTESFELESDKKSCFASHVIYLNIIMFSKIDLRKLKKKIHPHTNFKDMHNINTDNCEHFSYFF